MERLSFEGFSCYLMDQENFAVAPDYGCRLKDVRSTAIICIGSRPSDHYFRSVCLFVCVFVCAEFFSAVFDPISIKLGHNVICLSLVVSPRI